MVRHESADDNPGDDRPLIASFREPRTARELARFIELCILDGFGMHASGGLDPDGGAFDLELDGETVSTTVVVMPSDRWVALRGIEAHQKGGGALGPRFNPASN